MFKYVAIGPAGVGFFSLLGAVQMLQDTDKLDINELSGASAGALIAFFYILMDGNVKNILDETISIDLKTLSKVHIRSFINNYGFINIDIVREKIRKLCKKYMGNNDPTFLEFQEKYKIKLHIATYCVTDGKTVYFNVDNYPSVSVIDTVCASIAVPFLFASQTIDSKIYVDGGIGENIPAEPFLSRKREEICSIEVISKPNAFSEITDIKAFSQRLIKSLLTHRIDYDTTKIIVELGDFDIFDFKIPDKDKLKIFVKGYMAQ